MLFSRLGRDVAAEVLDGDFAQLAGFSQLNDGLIDGFQQARIVLALTDGDGNVGSFFGQGDNLQIANTVFSVEYAHF